MLEYLYVDVNMSGRISDMERVIEYSIGI